MVRIAHMDKTDHGGHLAVRSDQIVFSNLCADLESFARGVEL